MTSDDHHRLALEARLAALRVRASHAVGDEAALAALEIRSVEQAIRELAGGSLTGGGEPRP